MPECGIRKCESRSPEPFAQSKNAFAFCPSCRIPNQVEDRLDPAFSIEKTPASGFRRNDKTEAYVV